MSRFQLPKIKAKYLVRPAGKCWHIVNSITGQKHSQQSKREIAERVAAALNHANYRREIFAQNRRAA